MHIKINKTLKYSKAGNDWAYYTRDLLKNKSSKIDLYSNTDYHSNLK